MTKYWAIMVGTDLELGVGKKNKIIHPCLYIQVGSTVRTLATFKTIFTAEKFIKIMKKIIGEVTSDDKTDSNS